MTPQEKSRQLLRDAEQVKDALWRQFTKLHPVGWGWSYLGFGVDGTSARARYLYEQLKNLIGTTRLDPDRWGSASSDEVILGWANRRRRRVTRLIREGRALVEQHAGAQRESVGRL